MNTINLTIDKNRRLISIDDQVLQLSKKQYRLMVLLADGAVSYGELWQELDYHSKSGFNSLLHRTINKTGTGVFRQARGWGLSYSKSVIVSVKE